VLRQSVKNKIEAVAILHISVHYIIICSNFVDAVNLPAVQFSETML